MPNGPVNLNPVVNGQQPVPQGYATPTPELNQPTNVATLPNGAPMPTNNRASASVEANMGTSSFERTSNVNGAGGVGQIGGVQVPQAVQQIGRQVNVQNASRAVGVMGTVFGTIVAVTAPIVGTIMGAGIGMVSTIMGGGMGLSAATSGIATGAMTGGLIGLALGVGGFLIGKLIGKKLKTVVANAQPQQPPQS